MHMYACTKVYFLSHTGNQVQLHVCCKSLRLYENVPISFTEAYIYIHTETLNTIFEYRRS